MSRNSKYVALAVAAGLGWWAGSGLEQVATNSAQATATANRTIDWPQLGGDAARNNAPVGHDIPFEWEVGDFDYKTGDWDPTNAVNIKWVAKLGSQTYGNPVVAEGKIYVGTNNHNGWLERYPSNVDLGCLLCFDLETGEFLWQHSSEKLPSGAVHDWPQQGICSTPLVERDRLWFVTSRGEVRCLDTAGFRDGENDGPFVDEELSMKEKSQAFDPKQEADVVWSYDMMAELGISQHNMCSCSVTAAGDVLFVNTSNGVDEDNRDVPAPEAASFLAMDKNTGEVLWTDNSPGSNILHGQWSSPAYGVLGGQEQVIFAGGDGWVYSFDPKGDSGKAKLLWKFDANPKESVWEFDGRGNRNSIVATPVIYQGHVYIAVGQDPDHGAEAGHLWCIDPTKRGDTSPELAFNSTDPDEVIAHKRLQAVDTSKGEEARPNPNSAVVWHYRGTDQNNNGEIDFEEEMHRSCGAVAVSDKVLYIADIGGVFHCLDAQTGKVHWTYDMLAAAWGSPLIVEDKVYIGDEDGEVAIFRHSADKTVAMQDVDGDWEPAYGTRDMGNSVYSTPIVADNVLYISNRTHLFAIEQSN